MDRISYDAQFKANRLVNEYIHYLLLVVRNGTFGPIDPLKDDHGRAITFLEAYAAYERIKQIITDENKRLLETTHDKMAAYASDYSVDTTSLDPYKFLYWFCETCMERFPTGIEAKLARRLMSHGMNELLQSDVGKQLAPVMNEKIKITVSEGRLREVFGKYGLYKIFKNCAMVCRISCHSFNPSQYPGLML